MDWLFRHEEGICHVRVSGVMLRENHLLVQRARGRNEYALPGGHLKFGETTEAALVREYLEETGLTITCGRLLWTEENFWCWSGTAAHNIGFYYLIDAEHVAVSDEFAALRDNSDVEYGWVPLERLGEINLFPRFLKDELACLGDAPKHLITRD